MRTTAYDIFGTPVVAGDQVVISFPEGNSAVLRVGKVVKFRESMHTEWEHDKKQGKWVDVKRPIDKMEVEWDANLSPSWVPKKPTLIEYNQSVESRMMKLVKNA